MLSPGCAVSRPEAVERSYLPCQGIALGNLWGDLPPRVLIGSSKDCIHRESHPLDIGISDFIGAVLVLFLAVRKKKTLTKSNLREMGFIGS